MSNLAMPPSLSPVCKGAAASAFHAHPGYQRMFRWNELTLGIFLPLRFYQGEMSVLEGQSALVEQIDQYGFAATWVRDVPLFDPRFGDAGQVFDPFTYLAFLAARTTKVSLVTGSAIFSLRHPIDLAKSAATIDQLSGGRLVLGVASGDRAVEFPAYGIAHEERGDRFAAAVDYFRQLLLTPGGRIDSALGKVVDAELFPKPVSGRIPIVVTGSSRQSLQWIAEQADGWLTYPESTENVIGPRRLAEKIRAWRDLIPDGGFRPHMTNEWIDLVEQPDHPRMAINGGYVLRTGRNGLIDLLGEWREAGVNHAAIGIQFSQRPAAEVIQELAEYVLPLFPSHHGAVPKPMKW